MTLVSLNSDTKNKELLLWLAKRIKSLRTNKGLTQLQCFNDTNIHFGRIEQGNRDISFLTLYKICRYLNISHKDFFEDLELECDN